MLHIVLWKWDQPGGRHTYLAEHVDIMCAMLRRNLTGVKHRIICVTDSSDGIMDPETFPLWSDCIDLPNATGKQLPSCYRRLKLYDEATQKDLGIAKGDRILSIDLDTLITGDLKPIVETEGLFVGWGLLNERQEPRLNGSFQMFTAGTLQHIWSLFDPAKSPKEAFNANFKGSDQAWLSYNLIGKEGTVALGYPMISSYPLQNRIQNTLKHATRIIFFHGSEKPWSPNARFHTPWIDRYWRP